MNDNDFGFHTFEIRDVNEWEQASIGDIFRDRSGNEWEVAGFFNEPTVFLVRTDKKNTNPFDRPTNCIVPSSDWARNWSVAYHKSGMPKYAGDEEEE